MSFNVGDRVVLCGNLHEVSLEGLDGCLATVHKIDYKGLTGVYAVLLDYEEEDYNNCTDAQKETFHYYCADEDYLVLAEEG